jgi:hypothetical protein
MKKRFLSINSCFVISFFIWKPLKEFKKIERITMEKPTIEVEVEMDEEVEDQVMPLVYRIYKGTVQRQVPCFQSFSSHAVFLILLDNENQVLGWIGSQCSQEDITMIKGLAQEVMAKDYDSDSTDAIPLIYESDDPTPLLESFLEIFNIDSSTYYNKASAADRRKPIENSSISIGVLLPYTDSALFELKETAFAHPDTDGTVSRVPFPPLEKTTVVYMNVGDQWDLWFSKDLSPETTFRALKSIQNLIEAQISRSSALNNNSNKVQQYLFITQQGQERQCFRRCLKIFTDFQPFVDAQTIINTSALQKELAKKQQQRQQEQLQLEQPEPPQPPPSEKKRPKSLAFQVDPIVLNNNNTNNNYSSNEGKYNNDEDNNENANEVRITRDLSAIHRSGAKTNSPMTGILKSPKNAAPQTTTSTPTNKTSNTGKAADMSPAVPRTNFWTINKQLTPQNHLQVSGKSPKGSGTTNPMKTTMSSNAMTVGGGSSDGFALGNDSPMNKSNNDLLAPPFQPIRMKENDNHAITVELLELRERENLPLKDRKALLWESCVLPETLLGWQVSGEKAF